MLMLLALLTATPTPCEALWPAVWTAHEAQELKGQSPPLFENASEAKDRLGRAWIKECRAFTQSALDCARGLELEAQLADFRRYLKKEVMPPGEIDDLIGKVRRDWSILSCPAVERALQRAGDAVALSLDAGVPRSDDCAGADLASGKCQCAHLQCMDMCCPEGWACAHTGATTSKCIRPR